MPVQQINPTTRIFSDLDLNFVANPTTGDIQKIYDNVAIKRSVETLVQTANYERKFHSSIGSQISNLLFEPFGPMTNIMIQRTITDCLLANEPRIELIAVNVGSDSPKSENSGSNNL